MSSARVELGSLDPETTALTMRAPHLLICIPNDNLLVSASVVYWSINHKGQVLGISTDLGTARRITFMSKRLHRRVK